MRVMSKVDQRVDSTEYRMGSSMVGSMESQMADQMVHLMVDQRADSTVTYLAGRWEMSSDREKASSRVISKVDQRVDLTEYQMGPSKVCSMES